MAGTEREAWSRARNARNDRLSSIRGSGRGDTCEMEHAVACRQFARESCRRSPQKKLSALTQPRLPREKGARGKELADVLACLAVQPSDKWLTPVPTIVPTPAPTPALVPAPAKKDLD